MTSSTITLDVIDEKMLIFDKYLERSHMDKKAYQYDGVKWCLKNELLQPLLFITACKKYSKIITKK